MFGLQIFAILLPVLMGLKLVGGMLGFPSDADKSWWRVLLSAIGPGFGMFIAVALTGELQKLRKR